MTSIPDPRLDFTDAATATLLAQIQLEDLELIVDDTKGKSRNGELSDADLARQLYREDLERIAAVASDRRMTESIARAVQLDGPGITANLAEDDVIARDHDLAQQISQGTHTRPSPLEVPADDQLDDEFLEKLAALFVAPPNEYADALYEEHCDDDVGESSSRPQRSPQARRQLHHRCEACHEDRKFFDVARASCGHEYCRDCLEELFRMALMDDSLFPPRCCRQPIDLRNVRLFVPWELVEEMEKKRVEFTTPNRTYCHVPQCSMFIAANGITNGVATCPGCDETTCITCKGSSHAGDCPEDIGLQQAIGLAQENGWQRCTSCWTVVELGEGCFHITCRCGNDFCYVCGERWKTCGCEQWEPVRLRRRAALLVDRDQVALPPENAAEVVELQENADAAAQPINLQGGEDDFPAPPVAADPIPDLAQEVRARRHRREVMVERMMENLRENHDCNHNRWRWVRGSHQCEECMFWLPEYIFECRQCRIQACNRCRRNRL